MSVLYVTSLGKTASKQEDALEAAKTIYQFDRVVAISSCSLYYKIVANLLLSFGEENIFVHDIKHPYSGSSDYLDEVTILLNSIKSMAGKNDEIVINSSGGTEKMSCIIKDVSDILRCQNYKVKRIFGTRDIHTGEVIFTELPDINILDNRGIVNE